MLKMISDVLKEQFSFSKSQLDESCVSVLKTVSKIDFPKCESWDSFPVYFT
jgi:hypothetical protein